METVLWVLGILAALSHAIVLWQWVAARRFQLHQRTPNGALIRPRPISVLKPLKGANALTRDCLESWLTQETGAPLQILFGVDSPSDPVCDLVRQFNSLFPHVDASLVVCSENRDANPMVSKLIQLARHAKHDVLVIADADVKIPQRFLPEFTGHLENPGVGLVNSFYEITNKSSLPGKLEAVAINGDFWSQVLQSNQLKPMHFALGAVIGIQKSTVQRVGGFEAVANFLPDDYQLGHRVAKLNLEVRLCPIVVECLEPACSWRRLIARQLRWAKTVRTSEPVPYFFSIIGNGTLRPLLWMSLARSAPVTWFSVYLCLSRSWIALNLQERLTRKTISLGQAWLVPLRDLMGVLIWMASFAESKVTWHGVGCRVGAGGKLSRA